MNTHSLSVSDLRYLITFIFIAVTIPAGEGLKAHPESKPDGDARKGGVERTAKNESRLKLSVVEAGQEVSIPAMIRVLDEKGQAVKIPGLQDRCVGLPKKFRQMGWYVLPASETLSLPASKLTLELVSGLERTRKSVELDLGEGETHECRIELKRFWNSSEAGWVSGNTHLHLKDLSREEADRYLSEVSAADGLQMVFVSYLERALVDRTYISNGYSRADLTSLSSPVTRFGNGQEYRHNFGGGGEGYGHVLFLNQSERVLPSSLGPGIAQQEDDGTVLRSGIQSARDQGSTILWCHNQFGYEDIPSWLSGLVHAQNIFDGGNSGSYGDTFYRYLNLGVRVPFSTGTDWFIYDYSRVYAQMGGGDLSPGNWLAALRKGRTFITNGPLLEFTVNGKGPGEEIPSADEVSIRYRVLSRENVGMPELIVNGSASELSSTKVTGHPGWFEAEGELTVALAEPAWLALRVNPENGVTNEFQRQIFAHTSPVYVNTSRGELFHPETAHLMIKEIQSDLAVIEAEGVFATSTEKETVSALYEEAIRALQQRLKN